MVNPPPRMTYPLSDFVIDEKYLGSEEYWRRSGLSKSRYMISNKGQVKGPRGMIRSPKRDNSIEIRNLHGNPQFFRLILFASRSRGRTRWSKGAPTDAR